MLAFKKPEYILFRIIELTLTNELNLPFRLRICSNELSIDKFDNCENRHYHLEEIAYEENDYNKDALLIPVAHYIKVNNFSFLFEILFGTI